MRKKLISDPHDPLDPPSTGLNQGSYKLAKLKYVREIVQCLICKLLNILKWQHRESTIDEKDGYSQWNKLAELSACANVVSVTF